MLDQGSALSPDSSPILVTGVAGFIGFHVARRLLSDGRRVVGLDNLNSYYDPRLKEARLSLLEAEPRFSFFRCDIAEAGRVREVAAATQVREIIHLAAQAGVRWSVEHPHAYTHSNIAGTLEVLEAARHERVSHLVYASSSSVYGANTSVPFRETDDVSHPVSLYAATKLANEAMAFAYSHLYGIPATGLRFFTVYGPWGRPDMAYFKFTRAILAGEPIDVFNHGKLRRDFTYIDDIVEGIVRVLASPPSPRASVGTTAVASHRVFNIGNDQPIDLESFITALENAIGQPAIRRLAPMQPGDVPATWADVSALNDQVGFRPTTPLPDGLRQFVKWYREYVGTGQISR